MAWCAPLAFGWLIFTFSHISCFLVRSLDARHIHGLPLSRPNAAPRPGLQRVLFRAGLAEGVSSYRNGRNRDSHRRIPRWHGFQVLGRRCFLWGQRWPRWSPPLRVRKKGAKKNDFTCACVRACRVCVRPINQSLELNRSIRICARYIYQDQDHRHNVPGTNQSRASKQASNQPINQSNRIKSSQSVNQPINHPIKSTKPIN